MLFPGCKALTSLDLSACTSLTKIGSEAFYGCTGLTSLDLSACTSLTKIDSWTFKGCAGLTEVKLPASLTKIGFEAFKGCKALTEVKLPASLTEIGKSAFAGCTGLTSAVFADKNNWKVYDDDDYSGTPTPISSSNLADPATAAKYLREETYNGGYSDKYWKKN